MLHYYRNILQRKKPEPPDSYLLDDYPGAEAAYSTRLLRSAYSGNCMRVRRASDDAEQDIGFRTTGVVDLVALSSFIGSSSAFVVTWYDQTTNGRDVTQSTLANQPRIADVGSVIESGSRPALDFLGGDDKLVTASGFIPITGSSNHSFFTVAAIDAAESTQTRVLGFDTSAQSPLEMGQITNEKLYDFQDVTIVSGTPSGAHIYENYIIAGNTDNYYDGTNTGGAATTNTETNSKLTIGGLPTLARSINGKINEVIVYASNQITGDRSSIFSNINNWYSI